MKPTRWSIALYMALVFVCGGVVGAFTYRLYTVADVSANVGRRNPEEFRKRFLADLKERLNLNSDQATKLAAIMDETRQQFKTTRDSIEPALRKIRDDQRQRISELLSADQLREWEKIVEERRRARESKKNGGPPSFR